MLTVYSCLTQHHDGRLVLLAAIVCLLASATAVSMLARLASSEGWRKAAWLACVSTVTGIGIWATHFIAMLAFRSNLPTGYDLRLTALSLAVAIVLLAPAYLAATRKGAPSVAISGGALVGLAISAMHYCGMAAFQVTGHLRWDAALVAWSIVLGMGFGAAALLVARRRSDLIGQVAAALLLTLAICGMHFTAMGAASILPDPTVAVAPDSLPAPWLAGVIAFGAVVLLIVSLAALVMRRQQRFAEQRRLHELANAAVEGLVVCDQGAIVTANDSFERLVGARHGELVGRRFATLFGDAQVAGHLAQAEEGQLESFVVAADGEPIPVELIARTMPYNGRMHQGVAVRDLRPRRKAEAQIRFLADHDPLTGLPNRANFNERLEREFERHRRKDDSFAVLCLDLDRFRQVNDLLGQAAGDAVLKAVTDRLSPLLHEHDVFARLGGDEFAILRLGPCRPADLAQLSDQILAALVPEFTHGEQTMLIGASIGIALYPADGDKPETLMRNADAALSRAKEDGRSTYRFFEPSIGAGLRERQLLEFDLRHAIARNELSIVFQPQSDVATKAIFGFEALLRWTQRARGPVSPVVFIPIAEESGLILPIGEWVLREVCREAASWPNPLQVAVNLSGVQLHTPDLPALVQQILAETGLSPGRLELEITETALIQDFDHALHALRQIKALGVRIAMDDFGTGYSSLSNLRAFPFDKIKIDQSFVRNVHCSEEAAAIVRAIVGLAHGLHLTVIAEGVECPEELEFLRRERCAEAQGYLIGKPADISLFAGLVGETPRTARHGEVLELATAQG